MSEMGSSATEAGEAHMPMHVRFAPKAAIRSKSRDPPRRARSRHSAVFTRAMTALAKSWRRDLLPPGGLRLLHLLHQPAFGFRQLLKCLVRRTRGTKLVSVPAPPGSRRLLHLIQIHFVGHPAVLSDFSVLGKEVVDGRGAHLPHRRRGRVAAGRLYGFEIVRGRRVDSC